MAGRSDAASDRISLASSPSMANLTFCGWFQIHSAASINVVNRWHFGSGGNSSWLVGFKGTNGRQPSVYSPSNSTGISAPQVALDTWIFLAATLSGTAAALHYGTTPGSLTKVTGTVGASGTPDGQTMFGRSPSDADEPFLGTAAHVRQWQALLSDAEIVAESQVPDPARTSNLWGDWDFADAALTDGSGNGHHWSAGSTALSAAADPVLSTASPRRADFLSFF